LFGNNPNPLIRRGGGAITASVKTETYWKGLIQILVNLAVMQFAENKENNC
jgi:hypothetical protein